MRPRRSDGVSGRPSDFTVRWLNVARYEVTVQGRGIAVPINKSVAVGFLRLVQVRAKDPVEAELRAIEVVKSDWALSAYAFSNRSDTPNLSIFRIGLLSWWHRFLGSPQGYIFFAEDGVLLPSNDR